MIFAKPLILAFFVFALAGSSAFAADSNGFRDKDCSAGCSDFILLQDYVSSHPDDKERTSELRQYLTLRYLGWTQWRAGKFHVLQSLKISETKIPGLELATVQNIKKPFIDREWCFPRSDGKIRILGITRDRRRALVKYETSRSIQESQTSGSCASGTYGIVDIADLAPADVSLPARSNARQESFRSAK